MLCAEPEPRLLAEWMGCFILIRQAVRRGGEMRARPRQGPAAVSHRVKDLDANALSKPKEHGR